MKSRKIAFTIRRSPIGRLLLAGTARGVCHIRFGDDDRSLECALREEFPFAVLERDDETLAAWASTVLRCVAGEDCASAVPLDVCGSRFQRRVWSALQGIPRGQTRAYGEVASSLGMPRAARAVARACATNPVAVLVPCHRVVGARGLGGYAYGLERKRALLAGEVRGYGKDVESSWNYTGIMSSREIRPGV